MLKYVSGDFPGATWGDGAAVYLEWGGGGSTSVFGTRAARTHTVEHHPEWCAAIREWDEIKCLRDAGAWRLFCHDVAERTGAPLAKWGRPAAGLDPGAGDLRRQGGLLREISRPGPGRRRRLRWHFTFECSDEL